MREQRRVWAIYYTVRVTSTDSWNYEWIGPCGIFLMEAGNEISSYYTGCLTSRPFFFRTRALARQKAKELARKKNVSWKWIKFAVRPITLSWNERN